MHDNFYKNYLKDLIFLLKEDAQHARKEKDQSSNDYNSGRLVGYYEVMGTILNQAEAFQIDLKEIGLEDFNLEKELH